MDITRSPLLRICGFMVGRGKEWLVEYEFVLAGNLFAFDVPHSPWGLGLGMKFRSEYHHQHVSSRQSKNWWAKVYYLDYLYKESKTRSNVMKLCSNVNPY